MGQAGRAGTGVGATRRDRQSRVEADPAVMREAIAAARTARVRSSPNPWVGCVIEPGAHIGATEEPGGRHAEIVALDAAGADARGATVYVTLEPCSHQGRTPPCVDRLIDADIARVVVGLIDPDPRVAGSGIAALAEAGIEVETGLLADEVSEQLAPYLKHRRTGRPWVVLKLAATVDGRTAAPDGTSRWITSAEARADAHRLRAESDAVLVGAGTLRTDDPELTVRLAEGRDPLRVVLGAAPSGAAARPCLEMAGEPGAVLDELGARDVVQLLVEGGADVAGSFHRAGLVDRYVFYVAPAMLGGDDGRPVLAGPGVPTMDAAWRGRVVDVRAVGPDVRIEVAPAVEGVS